MKAFRIAMNRWSVLAGAVFALTAACASAMPRSEPASRVEVTWTNPADFAEARQSPSFGVGRQEPEEWLGELAKHLQRRAERVLAPGQHLNVTFTDVKRAGTYEPWRGPLWNDIRVIKDIYPPRIDLRFTLTGADGATLREGERSLRDIAFLSRSTPTQNDPLRYEKRLLDDWLRREFQPARASAKSG